MSKSSSDRLKPAIKRGLSASSSSYIWATRKHTVPENEYSKFNCEPSYIASANNLTSSSLCIWDRRGHWCCWPQTAAASIYRAAAASSLPPSIKFRRHWEKKIRSGRQSLSSHHHPHIFPEAAAVLRSYWVGGIFWIWSNNDASSHFSLSLSGLARRGHVPSSARQIKLFTCVWLQTIFLSRWAMEIDWNLGC